MDKELVKTIDLVLRGVGFEKKRHVWYRSLNEVWQIVSLEKDFSWGNRYSLSFGVFVKRVDPAAEYPKERFSHIRCGEHKVLGEDSDKFRYEVMDLSHVMDAATRWGCISQCLDLAISSFFDLTNAEENIRQLWSEKYFEDTLFHVALKSELSLQG